MNQKLNKYLNKSNLTKLAQIAGFRGSMGEIILKLISPNYDINEKEPLIVEFNGYMVPFFIVDNSIFYDKKNTISLKFKSVKNNIVANNLIGKNVWALTETLIIDNDEFDDNEVFIYRDFSVIDQYNNSLGIIKDIDEIPGNPLIIIESNNGVEILVPLMAAEVINQDLDNKIVKLSIPEGLIEALH
ncbi:MAG: hypothetical protein MJ211_12285 [Bacteroidales bacterium]|nr:hypothetical protein [Bacteroidales bacterium]